MMFDSKGKSSNVSYYAPQNYYTPQTQKNAWMIVIMRKLFYSFLCQTGLLDDTPCIMVAF